MFYACPTTTDEHFARGYMSQSLANGLLPQGCPAWNRILASDAPDKLVPLTEVFRQVHFAGNECLMRFSCSLDTFKQEVGIHVQHFDERFAQPEGCCGWRGGLVMDIKPTGWFGNEPVATYQAPTITTDDEVMFDVKHEAEEIAKKFREEYNSEDYETDMYLEDEAESDREFIGIFEDRGPIHDQTVPVLPNERTGYCGTTVNTIMAPITGGDWQNTEEIESGEEYMDGDESEVELGDDDNDSDL